ncbi:PT domain-containing protein [Streptacidiphilus rugosus]|uniref:PT domain-containing protein n=1 Tax=Streptacidiphilus rugosus TaxID=405783 RepID=UPI0012F76217|nr:PT domain-containing protein [Streptacidiphilus rugosus]
MPGKRFTANRVRSERRRRRLLFGLPLALGVLVVGGLAFADVAPTARPVTGAAAPTNWGTVTSQMATNAPTMTSGNVIAANISVSTIKLSSAFSYLSPNGNGMPQWTRTVTAVAPDGMLEVAWQAANSVHVTPVDRRLRRTGPDVVITGAHEIGGLVAFDNGFALLTRVADHNRWGETAAALIRVRNGHIAFAVKLTGAAGHDTAPMLDGKLSWNGSRYAALFTVHGAGGSRNGRWGEKMVYVSDSGQMLSGGHEWNCRGDMGRTLGWSGSWAAYNCYDDGSATGSAMASGDDMVQTGRGSWVTALSAQGPVSSRANSLTWNAAPRWSTDQAVLFFVDSARHTARSVVLTSTPGTANVNVHVAPYGRSALLVTWESVRRGAFTGTHFRLIDLTGRFLTPDLVLTVHVSGPLTVLANGDLVWAFVRQTPVYGHRMHRWPTVTSLFLARLHLSLTVSGLPSPAPTSTAMPTSMPTAMPTAMPTSMPTSVPSLPAAPSTAMGTHF